MKPAVLFCLTMVVACGSEPPDLYAPPRPLVKFDRIPEPKKLPPPRKPPPRMSPEDAGRLLRTLFDLYQGSLGGPPVACVQCQPELAWEMKHYFLEARLFARAHPDITREFALRILEDADADFDGLRFVSEFLRPLHRQLDRRLEEAIVDLVDHPSDFLSSWAIAVLGSSSRRSRYRYHLWSLCSKGKRTAFQMLSYDDHPDTRQFLEDLKDRGEVPGTRSLCDEALARLGILRSPDWKERVEELLRGDETADYYWAKGIAHERLPVVLRRSLQRSLDECRTIYEPMLAECIGSLNLEDPYDPKNFAYHFVHSAGVPQMGRYFEFLLIDFYEAGGELTPIEVQRLHHFGFLGDPEERLLEIMKRRGQTW